MGSVRLAGCSGRMTTVRPMRGLLLSPRQVKWAGTVVIDMFAVDQMLHAWGSVSPIVG